MHKRLINPATQVVSPPDQVWLNLVDLAEVEISSEDDAYPIESALLPGSGED